MLRLCRRRVARRILLICTPCINVSSLGHPAQLLLILPLLPPPLLADGSCSSAAPPFAYSSCVSSRRMDRRPVSPHAILITGPARANDTILDPSRRRIANRSRTPFTKDRNFRSARGRYRCTRTARSRSRNLEFRRVTKSLVESTYVARMSNVKSSTIFHLLTFSLLVLLSFFFQL